MPCPLPRILVKCPYARHIDFDGFVDYVEFVESIDNLQGLIDGLDVKSEVVCFEDSASLEPLDNACLALARAFIVGPLGHPPERTFRKGIVERII